MTQFTGKRASEMCKLYLYVYIRREAIEEGFAAWEDLLAAMQ